MTSSRDSPIAYILRIPEIISYMLNMLAYE
jgi:hypothetical protein